MRLSKSLLATGWLLSSASALPSRAPALTGRGTSSVKFRSVPRTNPAFTTPKINVMAATGDTNINLDSSRGDLIYIAEATIGGTDYIVQLDTGSSDLWVHTTGLNNAQSTSVDLTLSYGTGSADGSVVRAEVQFAGFTVPSQALLDAILADNPVLQLGAVGVLGLGFTSLSNIDHAVNETGQAWGRSLLYNIFSQDPSVPNFITFLLTRSNDPEAPEEGSFTISETENGYDAVTSRPRIPTWPPNGPTRWNVLLDAFAVHDKRFTVGTTVSGVGGARAVILLDSGTTFSYAPATVVNAMYRGLPGAQFNDNLGQWVLPCDTRVEVILYIGGEQYHLHPLDMVLRSTVDTSVCVGTFTPASTQMGQGEYDWLVGVNVLRSFYTLYDYGDPVNNSPEGVAPHVQLLQLRTPAQARQDFFNVRGGEPPAADPTGTTSGSSSPNPSATPNPGDNNGDPGDDDGEIVDGGSTVTDDQTTDGTGGKNKPPTTGGGLQGLSATIRASIQTLVDYTPIILGILGANVAIFVALVAGGVFWAIRRRKAARRPSPLVLSGSDYKSVAINEPPMSAGAFPTSPTTPGMQAQDGPMYGQAPAPMYDSSSLPPRRGLQAPPAIDTGDARHSSVY